LTDVRWREIQTDVEDQLNLRRGVRLMRCELDIVPMAGGILRAAVLLPAGADDWNDERRRVVLLHELTHVRRWDPLAVLAARFACAIYWFHPLVWLGAKWLQAEREHSCDDRVLAAGYLPSQYGRHLLEIAGASQSKRSVFAVGMPRRSQIEDRLRAILATDRRREPLGWRTVLLVTASFLAVVLPIATVQLRTHAAEPATSDVVTHSSLSLGDAQIPSDPVANPPNATDEQFCQSSLRNNVSADPHRFAATWTDADFRWKAKLGSVTFGSPVVSGGRVFVGTNNAAGYVPRFPADVDLGCLLCFRESDGEFLWQYSSPKLESGRIHDWPFAGICSSPLVDGQRAWFVSNRCELVCVDADGFHDDTNDGPLTSEAVTSKDEADVVWKLDMIAECGVSPHNMSNCSVTGAGELLFVMTSNGRGHFQMDAPNAPSFLAVEKSSGKLVWSDASPGESVLHGQWGSPAYGVIAGTPQVIFPGGDGWLYSFDVDAIRAGRTRLLWKFDCNPKDTVWQPAGKGTRNNLVATPVIHDTHVLIANGQEPQNGEGAGCLWCIDAIQRGDISSQLVLNPADHNQHAAVDRRPTYDAEQGDLIVANPNSGLVWKYDRVDVNGDGRFEFDETMHRTMTSVVVAKGLVIVPDIGGLVHCLDARTGRRLWAYDLMAVVYSTPLVVDDKVFVCDEDGDVEVFALADRLQVLGEQTLDSSIYSTPTVANGTLFIAARNQLLAIAPRVNSEG
ncbi:MAG: PQQ-binding-like beta-propeller repeat protein, partial [Planctomycetota bacterium]|nr:PQQ-binding-like beta-propeller repeat protein [Planctomycetota bacterium]